MALQAGHVLSDEINMYSCVGHQVSADNALMAALKSNQFLSQPAHSQSQAGAAQLVLGLTSRKFKSLKFRLRRREIKMVQSGTPFNKRDCLKNTNRQTAALQRKRDGNGKFLNIPIYPKKQTNESK